MGRIREWLELRSARSDALDLLAEGKGRLRRGRHHLTPEVREEVRAALEELRRAERSNDIATIERSMEHVARLLDAHLGFAKKSRMRELLEVLGGAVFLALFLRTFVVEAFTIPSGSMIPTLQVGDDIFVAKAAYGIRLPFTRRALVMWSGPERGDVVVFSHPSDGQDIIKRVIAVGGDTVMIREGVLHVNGRPVPSEPLPGPCTYSDYAETERRWVERPCDARVERLGHRVYVTYTSPGAVQHDFGPVSVPKGELFMMGDHRDDSNDSRYYGTVPVDRVKGRALVVWWSRGGPAGVRWHRLGRPVHAGPRARE